MFVVIDSFSKWIEAYVTTNNTSTTTTKVLLNEAFSHFGLPRYMDSDQGHILLQKLLHAYARP